MIYVSFHASFSGGKNISLAWSSWVFFNLKDQCSEWTTRPREQIWRNLNKEKKLVKRPNWKIIAKDLYKPILLWKATCLYERQENLILKLGIWMARIHKKCKTFSVKLNVRVAIVFTRGLISTKNIIISYNLEISES